MLNIPFAVFGDRIINMNYVVAILIGFSSPDSVTLFLRPGSGFPSCEDDTCEISLQEWSDISIFEI